jgi:phytoene synthase
MSVSLEESYALCRRIARQTGKNFYYSFLVMPPAKRAAMCAVYAFMRHSDDIADGAASPGAALDGLRRWRAQVDSALDGGEAGDPTLPALVDTVRGYQIPRRHFHEVLDGAEMDQTTRRYATFDELYKYCYRVASAVGLVVLPIFGYGHKDKAALVAAEACGIAFQLTNILRDVKEDAQMGRVYLPLEDLERFGVAVDDVLTARATPQFLELMKFEAGRAHGYYDKARPLVELIDRDSRSTLAVMMAIYGGILRKIEDNKFAVFDERIRLSTAEKLWIVGKNWWGYRI